MTETTRQKNRASKAMRWAKMPAGGGMPEEMPHDGHTGNRHERRKAAAEARLAARKLARIAALAPKEPMPTVKSMLAKAFGLGSLRGGK